MPRLLHVTDPLRVPDDKLFMLGVAHQGCIDAARARLEAGSARLPTELPDLQLELGDQVPPLPPYTLDKPVEPGACPFCDSRTGLTDEHIWPQWYSRELQARGAILTGDIIKDNRIEVTVPVCGDCNNKWMSVLEGDTRKLLIPMADAGAGHRPPMRLSAAQRTRLATWAVKTAYLIDAYQAPIIPRGFLQEFALKRAPNPWTIVWVGGYTPNVALRADKKAFDFLTSNGQPTNNSPNSFAITFTILNLVFQVFGHFNGGTWTLQGNRQQYAEALFEIWPESDATLSWPPSVGFSRISWDALVGSIKDQRTNLVRNRWADLAGPVWSIPGSAAPRQPLWANSVMERTTLPSHLPRTTRTATAQRTSTMHILAGLPVRSAHPFLHGVKPVPACGRPAGSTPLRSP